MGNLMDNLQGVFICDNCDTLATVSREGNNITINQCECITLDWGNE